MAANDLYRVALTTSMDGQNCCNVYYLKQLSDSSGETAEAAASHLLPVMATLYQTIIGRVGFGKGYHVKAEKVARLTSDIGEASDVVQTDGPNSTRLPTINSIVMSIKTGFAGPRRRGRVFLPGVPQDWVSSSLLNATGQAGYQAFGAAVMTQFGGVNPASNFRLGVFSRAAYSLLSNPFDDYWKEAVHLTIKPQVASMHSRKVGVGN